MRELRGSSKLDKLGNHRYAASSGSSSVNAFAWLRRRGRAPAARIILQMVQLTRVDCAIWSAGMMRAALARALHHCRHRIVFQKRLADQPMMRSVLADLALDVEGALAATMRLCRSFDLAPRDEKEAARARLLTPAIKYWVCKTAPAFVYEAMECLGGNGYVEDFVLARLYREAPVNAIWEGSGNVMGLDVLRALARDGEAARAVLADLARETADLPGAAEAVAAIGKVDEAHARGAVERVALLAAAAALRRSAPAVAEALPARGLAAGAARPTARPISPRVRWHCCWAVRPAQHQPPFPPSVGHDPSTTNSRLGRIIAPCRSGSR